MIYLEEIVMYPLSIFYDKFQFFLGNVFKINIIWQFSYAQSEL